MRSPHHADPAPIRTILFIARLPHCCRTSFLRLCFSWSATAAMFVAEILDCRSSHVNLDGFREPEPGAINSLNTLKRICKPLPSNSAGQNEILTKALPGTEDFSKNRHERPCPEEKFMLKLTTACVARLLVLSLAFAASDASAQSPIRIGWLSSLTGPLSSAAIAENQGVQFAVDEINASGGVDGSKLELITRDTSG